MIREGHEISDVEFESLRQPLMARILDLTEGEKLTTLAMLVGSVPDAVAKALTLHDNVRGLPARVAAEQVRA